MSVDRATGNPQASPPAGRRQQNSIDLSTVFFYPKGEEPPRRIKLTNASLPLLPPMKGGYISGFYGYQSKLDGLAAAANYAKKNRLELMTIDYVVLLDKPLVKSVVTLDLLDKTEFVSTTRIATSVREELADYWKEWLSKEGFPNVASAFKWAYPESFIGSRPDLVSKLMGRPEWAHIRLFAHPAKVTFHDRPLVVGTAKLSKAQIENPRARLRPEIEISLTA